MRLFKRVFKSSKGQLISKANYQAVNSSKKRTNEFVFTTLWHVFVRFWKKLKTPKRHFEINWPLQYINKDQDRKFASHLCSSESLVARVFCYFAYASFFLFANNITEAFLLYRCFKKIQEQTKSAKSIMGENSYMKRKQ